MSTEEGGRNVFSAPRMELTQGRTPDEVLLYVIFEQDGAVTDEKTFFFTPDKMLQLEAPSIYVREADHDESRFVLVTDKLARHVWLSAEQEGIFSDNDFDLIPGIPRTVQFMARSFDRDEKPFVPAKPAGLTVRSMIDWIRLT